MSELQALRLPTYEELDGPNAEDTEPKETVEATPKPKRKAKVKPVRTSEELFEATTRSMSDKEKNKHIEDLRDALSEVKMYNEHMNQNCESAYEKLRITAANFEKFQRDARAKLHFAKQAISTCHSSILLAGNLED